MRPGLQEGGAVFWRLFDLGPVRAFRELRERVDAVNRGLEIRRADVLLRVNVSVVVVVSRHVIVGAVFVREIRRRFRRVFFRLSFGG